MKNKLSDLNNHLFAALERLNDEDLTAEQLAIEVGRAKAVAAIGTQIVANANTNLEAAKFLKSCGRDYDSGEVVLGITGGSTDEGSK